MKRSKKAIILGASTGIGRALAKVLARQGYVLGLASRNEELLLSLQAEIPTPSVIQPIDLNETERSMELLKNLIAEMGGVDLVVINAGIHIPNLDLEWDSEYAMAQVNAVGFMAAANVAVKHFQNQGYGHLVGISSIAGLQGSGRSPAYSASKAFMSNYLAGLRQKLNQTQITVTDIRPGFVNTQMVTNRRGVFWIASCEKAAEQILGAIRSKKKVAYITKRWAWVAWLYDRLPERLLNWGHNRVIEKDREQVPKSKGQIPDGDLSLID